MFARVSTLILIVGSLILSSCAPDQSKIVLAEFGDDKITLGEFEEVYVKNSGNAENAKKDSIQKLKSFLDLYTNFRMKLSDAALRGFEENAALKAELADYKEKIGVSYLTEKKLVEPGIEKLYDQRKWELRVSHIMIRPDTMSDERAKAFAYSLIDSLKNGADWNKMVNKYSADNFSKPTGGDVYYLTAGTIVPEFEEAAYNTEPGKVNPDPVKTNYGYHIIKVTEKHERVPSVRASIILIDYKNDSSKVDSADALAKMKEVKAQADNNADFAELAKKYSEDLGTKQGGGDIGFFERRSMLKDLEEAAFKLRKGQVSDIITTNFGYALLKITDVKTYGSFEDEKEGLKKIYKKTRYDAAFAQFVGGLKEKYNFKFNNSIVPKIVKNCDSTKVEDYWKAAWRDDLKDSTAYTLTGLKVNVDTLFSFMSNQAEFKSKLIDEPLLNNAINKSGESSVLKEEANALDKTDPQFASLMKDYKNGIFIFKLQDDEVWSKIALDSAKLVQFYEQNKQKYVWPDRVRYSEIYSIKDSLINHYYDLLQKGENFDTLAAKYTERPGYKAKAGDHGFTDLNSALAKEADKLQPGQYSKPIKNGAGYSIVKLTAKDPSRIKTFEEAKAEVSGSFQDHESKRLEAEYINSLKNKFSPTIHYGNLEKAFKTN